jgi:hypothetical protein
MCLAASDLELLHPAIPKILHASGGCGGYWLVVASAERLGQPYGSLMGLMGQ